MNTLFDIGPILPAGFQYFPDFITATEETTLLNAIAAIELKPMQFHEYQALRKVAGFGLGWSFTLQVLKKGPDIPDDFNPLVEKIATRLKIEKQGFAQLLITEYPGGSVINWHRDAAPFDTIAGVSLLSDCIFKLRPQDTMKQTRSATIAVPVQRRSLYVMQGPAKSDWQHCTAPVKKIRYSLTFRTLKQPRTPG